MYPATAERHPYDYDDHLDSEEEEEERRLSEEHGEASEDAPSSRKRPATTSNTNTNNANTTSEADAAAAKEFDAKVVRTKKSRPTLQPSDLKGSKGLVYVRRSFPSQVGKFRSPSSVNKVLGTGARSNKYAQKMNQQAQITAAAQYTRSLMSAYRGFARELFPSLAPEDVFLKIEDLGSKKEVKDFLQVMREELRREYLEGIYGVEKAGRLLNELEYGLRQQFAPAVEEDDYIPAANSRAAAPTSAYEVENENEEAAGVAPEGSEKASEENVEANEGGNSASNNETNAEEPAINDAAVDTRNETEEVAEASNGDDDVTIHQNNDEIPSINERSDDAKANDEEEATGEDNAPIATNSTESIGEMETPEIAIESEITTEPLPKTQETSIVSAKSQEAVEVHLESSLRNDAVGRTQETLTVLGSYDDDDEAEFMEEDDIGPGTANDTKNNYNKSEADDEFSQDERFSQISVNAEGLTSSQNEPHIEEDQNASTVDDRFSQFSVIEKQSEEGCTQDDRFSQLSAIPEQSYDEENLAQSQVEVGSSQLSMEY